DNFSVERLAEAVRLVRGRARLEASGGLTLESARAVAETGVDYLAVGALTHSAPALDIGMDLRGAAGWWITGECCSPSTSATPTRCGVCSRVTRSSSTGGSPPTPAVRRTSWPWCSRGCSISRRS